jgi:hypothetical protein
MAEPRPSVQFMLAGVHRAAAALQSKDLTIDTRALDGGMTLFIVHTAESFTVRGKTGRSVKLGAVTNDHLAEAAGAVLNEVAKLRHGEMLTVLPVAPKPKNMPARSEVLKRAAPGPWKQQRECLT